MSISKDMLIEDMVEQYPETIGSLQQMGVQCMVCGEPVWGTLEEKVREKEIENLDEIVDQLNLIISKKQD